MRPTELRCDSFAAWASFAPGAGARARRSRRGAALVVPTLALVVLGAASMTLLTLADAGLRRDRATKQDLAVDLVAEGGLAAAFFDLSSGGSGNLGAPQAPIAHDGSSYWTTCSSSGTGLYTFFCEAQSGKTRRRLELTLAKSNAALGQWSAFGDAALTIADTVAIDSYDSKQGSYASQLGSSGLNNHAKGNGDIGGNQSIDLSGSSSVWGKGVPGVGYAVALSGSAAISGSTNPALKPVKLPPIEVPSIATSGAFVASTAPLASGQYHFSSLEVPAGVELTIQGPAQIVLDSCLIQAGAHFIVDPSAGPVEVFVLGSLHLETGAQMFATTHAPEDLLINLVGDNLADPTIVFDFDSAGTAADTKIWGTLYAPNAQLDLAGEFELFGSVVAKELAVGGNSKLHFDEALKSGSASPSDDWLRLAWRRLP